MADSRKNKGKGGDLSEVARDLGKTLLTLGFNQLATIRTPGLRLIGIFAFGMQVLGWASLVGLVALSLSCASKDKAVPPQVFNLAGGVLLLIFACLAAVFAVGWRHSSRAPAPAPPAPGGPGPLKDSIAGPRRRLAVVYVRIKEGVPASNLRKQILTDITRSMNELARVEAQLPS